MKMTTRERLARPLAALRARRSRPPAPASAPCAGPCGCELADDDDPAVHLWVRSRRVYWPHDLDAATAERLADRIKASGMLDDPAGWVPVGDVDVRVLSDGEVDALLAEGAR